MGRKGIIGLIIGALALTAVVAPVAYIGFSYNKISPDGEYEVISISSEGLSKTYDYDFGVITPGESKEQTFKIRSLMDKDVDYDILFLGEEAQSEYKYFNVVASANEESLLNNSLYACVSSPKTITRSLSSKQEESISFSYKLANDIPETMLGMSITFQIQFKAKLF